MFFYRTQTGAECDLVLVQGVTAVACIEIKLSNSPVVSKGSISCVQDLEPKYKFIITPQSETYPIAKDIIGISLKDFLVYKLIDLQ